LAEAFGFASQMESKAGRFAYAGFATLQATPPPFGFADPPTRSPPGLALLPPKNVEDEDEDEDD